MTILEKATIKSELKNIKAVTLTPSFTKYYFINKNGENVFSNTKLPIVEFGYAFEEHDNAIEFIEPISDEHAMHLIIKKDEPLEIDPSVKANASFITLLIANSISRVRRATKTTAKALKQPISSTSKSTSRRAK